MRSSLLPLVAALPLFLVSAAHPVADAPALDVFVECKCIPFLDLEYPVADMAPWLVSWTPDDGNQEGICSAGYCSEFFDPRPCNGSFKVTVTWLSTPEPAR